jgi:putative CocE/NonD family hydrolase
MASAQKPERTGYRASEFGKYVGYSEPLYEEWVRTSRYIEMSDGIKLAMDIIRPAKNGKPVEIPMPVIWNYYSYLRAEIEDGKIVSIVDISQSSPMMIKHGYVIVVVDARGTGASYGHTTNPVTHDEGRYGYEITEWIAHQPWCNGNVGMFGHSYSALMHFMIASYAPPHLKAVFPHMGAFDVYHLGYPGGIYRKAIMEIVNASYRAQEAEALVARVDEDDSGAMLAEARVQHKDNIYALCGVPVPFRDSEEGEIKPWTLNNPMTHLQEVNKSQIPVYQWAGWFDVYARDALQWYTNLKNPHKITIGPWAHSDNDPVKQEERSALFAIEQLRWFDYWLKGIDNGVMDEPPINYAVMDEANKWTWHTADTWPLPRTAVTAYYFSKGKTGSIGSSNDGFLFTETSHDNKGEDNYNVDYTATVGEIKGPRTPNRGLEDPDMTLNDVKGLTYTTPPLEEDVTVIGHPVITLYVKSTARDGNFYAYLEEVDIDGKSHYITDGLLKASHRAEATPLFDNLGLPWHRHHKEDVVPITAGEVVQLRFDMMPTANVFNKGNRIRVTITCANAGLDEIPDEKPPTITLMRNAQYPSQITLPTKNSLSH